jgi:hypothetical protein
LLGRRPRAVRPRRPKGHDDGHQTVSTQTARIAVCATLPLVLIGYAAGAQTPKASPTPAPTPVAFSARAHASITVDTPNGAFSGFAQLGLAQRAALTRIDVLSVKSDSFPVPLIVATVVIDRGANTITVWSDTTKLFRVQPFLPRPAPSATPAASPSATPKPAVRGPSPFSKLEVLSVTLKLTGHTTTMGLPTTGLSFELLVQPKGQKTPSHLIATTQLADEFPIFPLSADVTLDPGVTPLGAAPVGAKLAFVVDDLTRETPALTQFTVPAGYAEAPSLVGVLFPSRPRPAAGSTPAPHR